MKKRTLVCALAVWMAATTVDAKEARLRLRGLDLQTTGGAAEALQRITIAAKAFCGSGLPGRDYVDAKILRCRRQLIESTVDHLKAPRLQRLYWSEVALVRARG